MSCRQLRVMVIVSLPNSPSLPSPVTVMTFAPKFNVTDACQQGRGNGTGKKAHPPNVAPPLPPDELLQLTLWTVLLRVPFRVAVPLDVENPEFGSVIWIKSATSCRAGSSSPPPQPTTISAAQHRTPVRAFIAISSLEICPICPKVGFCETYTSVNTSTRVRTSPQRPAAVVPRTRPGPLIRCRHAQVHAQSGCPRCFRCGRHRRHSCIPHRREGRAAFRSRREGVAPLGLHDRHHRRRGGGCFRIPHCQPRYALADRASGARLAAGP